MSSRIRTDAKHVFDCFVEVVAPQAENEQPWILQCFPPSYKEKESDRLNMVPQFTFPCRMPITTVQHFSFVRTNLEAQWTFGFCRYAPNGETALCILSPLPWHELFFKLLNQCAELLQSSPGDLPSFLSSVHNARLPLPGLVFHAEWGKQVFTAATPSTFHLPSIPDNRNLTEYFNAVDSNNMLIIFASMLMERRILITSKKLSRLSASVQAANSLIYPMFWQHIFIPVLPAQLMDYLSAPMPFLIGVPDPLMKRIKRAELGEVVILDADNNKVETPFQDLDQFPPEVLVNLRRSLKPGTGLLGDSVARAFLQALVHLIGGYRDALRYRQGEKITFSEDAFIMSRSTALQPFLEQMLQLQIFRQFVDERLDLLNSGKGFSDEFELECVVFTEKSNKKFRNQYNAITSNVKKEGVALAKAVKDKANPAMKQAVRSLKDGGKATREKVKDGSKVARSKAKASYKDVKSKFRDPTKEDMDDSSSTQSAPSSPTLERSATLPTPNTTPLTRNNTDINFGRVLKYERFDPPEERKNQSDISPEFEELPRLEYNLMSELEEIMVRNKREGSDTTPVRRTERVTGVILPPEATSGGSPARGSLAGGDRKPSVVDLISLDPGGQEDQMVFDPLMMSNPVHQNQHRKLERAGTKSSVPLPSQTQNYSAGTLPAQNYSAGVLPSQTQNHSAGVLPSQTQNYSAGKYENYYPAGGASSQPQFRQFISSMTSDQATSTTRSSDDLLSEYGLLDLAKATITTSSQSRTNHSVPVSLSNSRPSFIHQPLVSSNGSLAPSLPSGPAPAIPPRSGGNLSFLYAPGGGASLLSGGGPAPAATLPVNSRLSTVGGTQRSAPPPGGHDSCRDVLADLDPLRSSLTSSSRRPELVTSSRSSVQLQPPSVPPRSKKQWTTFDT